MVDVWFLKEPFSGGGRVSGRGGGGGGGKMIDKGGARLLPARGYGGAL